MNRGNNRRRQGRFADAAPHQRQDQRQDQRPNQRPDQRPNQLRPLAGHCRDCGYLQSCLNIAYGQIAEWHDWSQKANHRFHDSDEAIIRLEERLEAKERQLTEMSSLLQKSREDVSERDSVISSLRESLQNKTMQAETIERFWKEECMKITARWCLEAE
eukprot:superscaffoldBa00000338_g3917